jgi:hypothetical protein
MSEFKKEVKSASYLPCKCNCHHFLSAVTLIAAPLHRLATLPRSFAPWKIILAAAIASSIAEMVDELRCMRPWRVLMW